MKRNRNMTREQKYRNLKDQLSRSIEVDNSSRQNMNFKTVKISTNSGPKLRQTMNKSLELNRRTFTQNIQKR